MMETLKSLHSLIITVLIVLILIFFRSEVKKLVNWIVAFKWFKKAKNGYEASSEMESRGISEEPKEKLSEEKAIQSVDSVREEKGEITRTWVDAFFGEKYDEASELLKEKIEGEKDEGNLGRLKSVLGFLKFMKDKKIGIEYFEDMIKEGKATVETYYWYASSHKRKENYENAIEIAKRGIETFEKSPKVYVLYELCADCLILLSREIEAIEFLAEGLRGFPEMASLYVKIADILVKLGMKNLAMDCCRAGIRYCPTEKSLLEKYGKIAAEMELYKEAMTTYLKLTDLEAENPSYWTLLGNQYLSLSFNDLALKAYKKGNDLASEKEGWIIVNIGNIMKNRGFATEGASYFKKAIALEPDYQSAHERLGEALKVSKEEESKRDEIAQDTGRQLRVSSMSLDTVITAVKEKQSESKIETKKD